MAEIDAARASLVIDGGDRGIGRPPVPAEPVHRLGEQCAGATERKRRHRRVSRRNAGIAGEAGDPHHPVVLLEERDQGVVIDRPVVGHAVEGLHAEVRRMQAREMRRVHHGAAAHRVEVHDLDRRVVVVDRVVFGPGADVGTGRIVAKGARLPIAARAGVRRRVHPAALLEAEDVHLRVGEAPGHRSTRRAGADDQHIHGIVHAGPSLHLVQHASIGSRDAMPRQLCCAERLVPACARSWLRVFRHAAADVMVGLQQEVGSRLGAGRLERENCR
jgi:hypothetical protein